VTTLAQQNTGGVQHVPEIAYAIFNKKYKSPAKLEGFSAIVLIPFTPHFESTDKLALFLQRQ